MASRNHLLTPAAAAAPALLLLLGACDTGISGAAQPTEARQQEGAAASETVQETAPETTSVRLGDEKFRLELALDEPTRVRGLGGRRHIDPNGGMLFVFERPQQLAFVMRDCYVPIDVAFLDGAGRVVAIHEMPVEPPRREDEDPWEYENRLKRYSSRFAAQFAVETAGGRMKEVGLQVGDLVPIDTESLKERVR